MTSKRRQTVTLLYTLFLMAGLLAPAAFAGGPLQPFASNGPTPNFSLTDLKDATRTLADYRGKVVVVNFWASWCPPCITEMPVLERLKQKLDGQPFEIVTINVGEKKYRVWKFVKLISFGLPVLLDERKDTFNTWGASVLPTSFLLDKEGHVRYRVQGDLEWDGEEVVSLINELIHEEENEQ